MSALVNRDARAFEVLPAVHDPLNSRNKEDDRKGDNAIVHAGPCYRQEWREDKQHRRDDGIDQPCSLSA